MTFSFYPTGNSGGGGGGSGNWENEDADFSAISNNGYFINATATATLPASPQQGNAIGFILSTSDILTIQANTGQFIELGSVSSSEAGTCTSTELGDCISLIYQATTSTWFGTGPVGNWILS